MDKSRCYLPNLINDIILIIYNQLSKESRRCLSMTCKRFYDYYTNNQKAYNIDGFMYKPINSWESFAYSTYAKIRKYFDCRIIACGVANGDRLAGLIIAPNDSFSCLKLNDLAIEKNVRFKMLNIKLHRLILNKSKYKPSDIIKSLQGISRIHINQNYYSMQIINSTIIQLMGGRLVTMHDDINFDVNDVLSGCNAKKLIICGLYIDSLDLKNIKSLTLMDSYVGDVTNNDNIKELYLSGPPTSSLSFGRDVEPLGYIRKFTHIKRLKILHRTDYMLETLAEIAKFGLTTEFMDLKVIDSKIIKERIEPMPKLQSVNLNLVLKDINFMQYILKYVDYIEPLSYSLIPPKFRRDQE